MNKAKRVFSLFLTALLLIMSVIILSIYDNVKDNTSLRKNQELAVFLMKIFSYLL